MSPLRYTVITKNGPKEVIKKLELKEKRLRDAFLKLGKATAAKMKSIIEENKVRPQAGEAKTLERSIKSTRIGGNSKKLFGWGVGEIKNLPKYWAAVNWGSRHLLGKKLPPGKFSPGRGRPSEDNFRKGRWKVGQGNFTARIKRPIPASNYIEKTAFWLNNVFDKLLTILR